MFNPFERKLGFMYNPNRGSYGIAKMDPDRFVWEVSHWYPCREEFHTQTYGMKSFFFYHGTSNSKNIGEFIKKFEDKLGIKKRTQVGNTNRIGTAWVQPATWWMKYATRRSLLTILLRSGVHYSIYRDNFEEALFADPYAQETRAAILYFLKGNTIYKGCQSGWVEAMRVPLYKLPRTLVPDKAAKKPPVVKTEVARI